MKKFLLLIAIVFSLAILIIPLVVTSSPTSEPSTIFTPDRQRESELEERHRERIAKRRARQAEFEHFMDSTILSHHYRFVPTMFNVEPAGSSHLITNPNVELAIMGDWADVHLPIFQGFTPPYRLVVYNTSVNIPTLTTVQTDNGWTIGFDSWLYSSNDYTFTLEVYTKTGGATLTISSDFYPTTSYWGSIVGTY